MSEDYNLNILPAYTAVVRTLGTAGDKYQRLLNSLINQTHRPSKIIIYLAEGYQKPKETVGIEKIVSVEKGMVAQRALPYNEVNTEWMLMLDDDVAIEPEGVERIFKDTLKTGADVCAVDAFPHHKLPLKTKILMAILLSAIPRPWSKHKGYCVSCIGTDIYNPNPKSDFAWSTTNSGAALICRKRDFLKIHFEEDLWLDDTPYAIPDDKVMFYKMHLSGLKIITHYYSGFTHLDAGSSMTVNRIAKTAYSSARNNKIFYEYYVRPNLSVYQKGLAVVLKAYQKIATSLYYLIKGYQSERKQGLIDAQAYLKDLRNNDDAR